MRPQPVVAATSSQLPTLWANGREAVGVCSATEVCLCCPRDAIVRRYCWQDSQLSSTTANIMKVRHRPTSSQLLAAAQALEHSAQIPFILPRNDCLTPGWLDIAMTFFSPPRRRIGSRSRSPASFSEGKRQLGWMMCMIADIMKPYVGYSSTVVEEQGNRLTCSSSQPLISLGRGSFAWTSRERKKENIKMILSVGDKQSSHSFAALVSTQTPRQHLIMPLYHLSTNLSQICPALRRRAQSEVHRIDAYKVVISGSSIYILETQDLG